MTNIAAQQVQQSFYPHRPNHDFADHNPEAKHFHWGQYKIIQLFLHGIAQELPMGIISLLLSNTIDQ
jgi:hypothetical protein